MEGNTQQSTQDNLKPLSDKLQEIRSMWTDVIRDMSEKLKDLTQTQSLLSHVYIKRAECAEYIATLRVPAALLQQKYKKSHAHLYQNYKLNSQLRYTSDSAINSQIEVDLQDMLEKIEMLKIHIDFMDEVLSTIDKLIYGVKERIEIYQLVNSIKF